MSYGGGGFVQSSQGGGGGGSQGSPGGKRATNLRPVTIAQIHGAEQAHPEAEFMIDNCATKDITFVAVIRSISKTTSNTSYVLEDGTGSIDARVWNATEEDPEASSLEPNTYVRLVGTLKSFNGKRNIHATQIFRIEDHNEIMFHGIEAIYVHLCAVSGGPPGGAHQAGGGGNNQSAAGGHNPYANVDTSNNGGQNYSDFTGLQRRIMEYVGGLSSSDTLPGEGINVGHAARYLKVDAGALADEVENLVTEGHLYHSIDDEHFLPTA